MVRRFLSLQYWRQVYLVTVLAMILAVFFAQIHPLYLSKQWKHALAALLLGGGLRPAPHRPLGLHHRRLLLPARPGGAGAAPGHARYVPRPLTSDLASHLSLQAFIPRVLVMYSIAALALIFYVSKVPERYFPGQLNYLGSSHQVWHLLLVLMFYWWHQSAGFIMAYRHSQPCSEELQH
ncbi:unnamed protein product, partial [Tetraodon nigroviridis]